VVADDRHAAAIGERPQGDIALIGLWHLGSVSAAGWSHVGRRVLAWDPDQELRETIKSGRAPVAEPDVETELSAALTRGTLTIMDDPVSAVGRARVTHLAFDTRLDAGNRPDDPRLDEAVNVFASAAPDGALLLVSSQIPVGSCRRWKDALDAQARGLSLAHAPENLRLGSALNDFLSPSRLVIGADDDRAYDLAAETLSPLKTTPIRIRLASAEMAKHATNAYLAVCIALANDLAWLSLHAGADPAEVTEALRADPRVAPSAPLRPGTAFSGATLIRDLATLRALGEQCGRSDLFDAVIRTNELHATVALTWLEESLGSLQGKNVAVAGLTYKAGTSTLRDSLPLRLITNLLDKGASVSAWDPSADQVDEPRPGLTRAASLRECVREADALAILTALPELATVEWNDLRPATRLVVDTCGVIDRGAAESAGWVYRGFSTG
jgi:UDPglucose 6-dehydrogenase